MEIPFKSISLPLAALLLWGCFSGCRIAINVDGYEFLTKPERALLQPFPGVEEIAPQQASRPRLYEVRTTDLQAIFAAHPYTLLVKPGCGLYKDQVQGDAYQATLQTVADEAYPVLFSTSFEVEELAAWAKKHNYPYPIFFLSSEEFGIKLKAKAEGVKAALYPEKPESYYGRTYMLFDREGELLYDAFETECSPEALISAKSTPSSASVE